MRLLPALVVVLLPALTLAQDAEPLTLRPDWQAGQTSRYAFSTTRVQDTTMSAAGRSQSMSSTMVTEGEVTWRVDQARPDGSYACTMTLDWMTVSLSASTGEERRIDSRRASGEPAPLHQVLKAMVGTPLTVTVQPDGTIASVGGIGAMKSRAPDPAMIPEELDFIESATDLATLPGVPAEIAPGGTWRSNFRWSHDLGHLNHNVTWRVTGIEEIDGVPLVGVAAQSTIKLDLDRSEMPAEPPIDVRMSGSRYDTQVIYDPARHEAVARNSTESRTFDFTIRFPQGTMTRRLVETITSQTLRISEQ